MKKKTKPWYENEEVLKAEKLIESLLEKANIGVTIVNNSETNYNYVVIHFETKMDPYLITLITSAFSSGSKHWDIQLIFIDGFLNTTVLLKVDNYYKDPEDLAREIQYKRGLLKLSFERYFQKVFPTY